MRASTTDRTEILALRSRLEEAEATLEAIRSGGVDAVVVSDDRGERTLAIEGATHPYHTLLNAMSDGAALVDAEGMVLFCNGRLAEMTKAPLESLRGSRFQQYVAPADWLSFDGFLAEGRGNDAREFAIERADGSALPVWIARSVISLEADPRAGARNGAPVVMLIVTDLTDRKRAEAERLALMTRLISAEDEERRRIARELHDETGQSLTALLVGLRAIEYEASATAEVRSAAQRLRGVAARTVEDVGRLARGLHPSVLDDMGLDAAVGRHVSDYTKAFGIEVDVRLEAIAPHLLPPLMRTTIYRVVQEALTNVARHARARMVRVELSNEGTMLALLIRDDGVGFDSAAALHEASGLGLHGMQERIALLGGSVEIESSLGQGTVVRVRIPARPSPGETTAAART